MSHKLLINVDLARIKTFVLDILAPLTLSIECDKQGGSLLHK